MKKRLLSTLLALCMALTLLPGTAYADRGDDISDLFRQGDTGNLLTIDDFSFLGHPVSELSFDIDTIKSIMAENVRDLTVFDENEMTWLGGDVEDSERNWIASLSAYQLDNKKDSVDWSYRSLGKESAPIGIGDIETNDSLETVLKKFGFSNAGSIAKKITDMAFVGYDYDTYEEAIKALKWSYEAKNGLYFSTGGMPVNQLDDGKWVAGRIEIWVTYHGNNFACSFDLWFENDQLTHCYAYKGKTTNTSSSNENAAGTELILPTDKLQEITDVDSAAKAVSGLAETMSSLQKNDPNCIDLATLYAETASAKAATKSLNDNSILINADTISDLQQTALKASEAVDLALTNGGITTARYLSNTVTFTTNKSNEITIRVDPDVLSTEVDKVRVEAPGYALTFKLSDLAPDLTDSLTFKAAPASVETLSVKNAVDIEVPGGSTTNSITVSLPADKSTDTTYQAVVNSSGTATASKYNPATTDIDGKVNASGRYSVETNEVNFTDITSENSEMQKAIKYLASHGISMGSGGTNYSPSDSISRAELAALVLRALGKVDSKATTSFIDVTPANWFYTTAASSQKLGYITGFEDNTFRGTIAINKEQIIVVAARVLDSEMNYKIPSNPATYLSKYSDTVVSWAQPQVALATRENLVVYRTDGTFSGAKAMTRGDAAIIIYRLFQRIW